MSQRDLRSLDLIRNLYIPIVEDRVPPVIRAGSATPWVAAVQEFFVLKANRHLRAICTLCDANLGEDALVIARVLFEHAMHLDYIAQPPNKEERELRAKSFVYDGERQRLMKLEELEMLRRRGKATVWADGILGVAQMEPTMMRPDGFISIPSLKDMATSLGGVWEERFFTVYWSISKLSHPSGLGSHGYMSEEPNGKDIGAAIAASLPIHFGLAQTALGLSGDTEISAQLTSIMRRFIEVVRSSDAGG